ncbi:hypothetical protein Tco_0643685 [Tanacetum coccineum]
MGRDTIQLESAVSTISQEYLLEFTSKYGIPEGLHPELPNPEDIIVDFPEGKIGVYTRFLEFANFCIPISQFLFDILGHYQIHLSQLSMIGAAKQKIRKKHSMMLYKTPGLLEKLEQSIFWVDERVFPTVVDWRTNAPKDGTPVAGSYSAADVAVLNTHHMDLFNLISAPNPTKVKTGTRPRAAHEGRNRRSRPGRAVGEIPPVDNPMPTEVAPDLGKEMAAIGPTVNKRRLKGGKEDTGANAPRKVLRRDHDTSRPTQSTLGGKSIAAMGLKTGTTFSAPASQETPADVSDPDPLSSSEVPTGHMATTEVQGLFSAKSPESGKSASVLSRDGSPGVVLFAECGFSKSIQHELGITSGDGLPIETKIRARGPVVEKIQGQDSHAGSKDPNER